MLNKVKSIVLPRVAPVVMTTRRHSPELAVGAGIIGLVAAGVLLARAHKKSDAIHANHELNMDELNTGLEATAEEFTIEFTRKQVMVAQAPEYGRYGLELVKLYGPSIALGTAGIALILGGHRIQAKRIQGLTAAVVLLQQGFERYRQRVVAELGPDADQRFLWGYSEETITIEEEGEDGKTKKVKKQVSSLPAQISASLYTRTIDKYHVLGDQDPEVTEQTLWAIQSVMQDRFDRMGWLPLNDVYHALGMEKTSYGQIVGWYRSKEGDNYVSFGLDTKPNLDNKWRVDPVWTLEFNVDGVMWDKISPLDFLTPKDEE